MSLIYYILVIAILLVISSYVNKKKMTKTIDMEGKLEIVGLYEYDDEYQVIDSNRTVWFQGSKVDCKKYIKKYNN
jgi:hypothetical protein